jgi:hypothetical protein
MSTQAFDVDDIMPALEDADSDKKVNWFHPRFGWCQGYWEFPAYTDCSHWARLPDRPTAVDPEEKMDDAFNAWIKTFPTKFEESALALLKTGFRAGLARGKRRWA